MKTQENNKLIADFMGFTESGFERKMLFDSDKRIEYKAEELKYHSDWNWLIPVVKKISNITKENDSLYAHKGLDQRLNPYTYDLDSIYKATVEFIKWYNHNKS